MNACELAHSAIAAFFVFGINNIINMYAKGVIVIRKFPKVAAKEESPGVRDFHARFYRTVL